MRSLANSLILREKIKTTEAKAKEIRPYVEKIITRGKVDSMASSRIISKKLVSPATVKKVIKDISPRYKDRKGGYLRITKLPRRTSDGSKMAVISFV